MAKDGDSKLFAFLGVLLLVIGFIIVYAFRRNDKYAMFYAKQGLILFFTWVIGYILMFMPIVGWIVYVFCLLLTILGLIFSLSGEERPVPIVGWFASNLKL